MAITFDSTNKVITLDSFNTSSSEMWSRWVDWAALTDNLKYLPAFSQLGGVAPVALYIYLENGWRVRPQEADGLTTVTGNLLVQGGGNPFLPTIGNYASQVFLETPVSAQAIEVTSGSGLSTEEHNKLMNTAEESNATTNRTTITTAIDGIPDAVLDEVTS